MSRLCSGLSGEDGRSIHGSDPTDRQPDHLRRAAGLWGADLLEFDTLGSTNRWALETAQQRRHGDLVWARRQTDGVGRFERRWITPNNSCLTISAVLDLSPVDTAIVQMLGPAAALAVVRVLRTHGLAAGVKWPNDVLVDDRKLAGILAERHAESGRVMLGIGLNVNLRNDDLAAMQLTQPVTSMSIETGTSRDVSAVLADTTEALGEVLEHFLARGWDPELADEWSRHDLLAGRQVSVAAARGDTTRGLVLGMDMQGALRLQDEQGREQRFWSGDVTIIRE